MIAVKYLLKVTKSAHIQKLNQLTFSCANLTACGRNINNAKTNEGPVSVQAEAGFFLEKYDEQADQEKTIICSIRQSRCSDL